MVLLHPNVVAPKLDFEKTLVDSLRPVAWFGTVGEFGRFWAARAARDSTSGTTACGGSSSLELPQAVAGLVSRCPAPGC